MNPKAAFTPGERPAIRIFGERTTISGSVVLSVKRAIEPTSALRNRAFLAPEYRQPLESSWKEKRNSTRISEPKPTDRPSSSQKPGLMGFLPQSVFVLSKKSFFASVEVPDRPAKTNRAMCLMPAVFLSPRLQSVMTVVIRSSVPEKGYIPYFPSISPKELEILSTTF